MFDFKLQAKSAICGGAALLLGASLALAADPPAPPPGAPAGAVEGSGTSSSPGTAPAPSDEAGVRDMLQRLGYAEVSSVVRDSGGWVAKAKKSDKTVTVTVRDSGDVRER
jgi:hypothetical protein